MGRIFQKSTTNFMSLPAATLANLLNGTKGITIHCLFKYSTITTTTDDNAILYGKFSGAAANAFCFLNVTSNAASTTAGNMRCVFRSSATTDTATWPVSTTITQPNVWYAGGATVDYTSKVMQVWLNGKNEGSAVGTFASTQFTSAAPSTTDGIGSAGAGSATANFDGTIAELAVWKTVLDGDRMQRLGAGYSPLSIYPAPTFYMPLRGIGPDADWIAGSVPTIGGTLAFGDHPPIRSLANSPQRMAALLARAYQPT